MITNKSSIKNQHLKQDIQSVYQILTYSNLDNLKFHHFEINKHVYDVEQITQ